MKIIISAFTLDYSGTPTYTLTLYNELVSRGHDVLVYSIRMGVLAEQMNAVDNLKGVEAPDIILAQHRTPAMRLKVAFPDTPIIFIAHGMYPEEEQPPRIDIDYYLPVNEQCFENMIGHHVDPQKIKIVRDFVDTEEFKPTTPLATDRPKVLFVSNYKKWRAYQDITKACSQLDLDFKAVGSPYGRSRDMAKTINEADLVVTWGRGILEAMACGRVALSYNKRMGAGYITPEVYMDSRKYNFGGYRSRYPFGVEGLIEEIKKYNPDDGVANRDLVMEYHDSKKGVDQIMGIVETLT